MNKITFSPKPVILHGKDAMSQSVADFIGSHGDSLRLLLIGSEDSSGVRALRDLLELSGDPFRCPDLVIQAAGVLLDALLSMKVSELEEAGDASVLPNPLAAHSWNVARLIDLTRTFGENDTGR